MTDGEARAAALQAFLTSHPDAWVGAINRSARFVSMPAEVPVNGHRLLQDGFALSPIHADDRVKLTTAYRNRSIIDGGAATVRFAAGGTGSYRVFDVRERWDVDIVTILVDGGGNPSPDENAQPPMASRFCRILRDEGGHTIEIDEAATRVLGIPAETLMTNERPLDRVHPADHGVMLENWLATLANETDGHRCRVRIVRGDGSLAWMEVTAFNRLDDPVRPHIITEMLDISAEMSAQEEVVAREQLLHRLAEALPLGVVQLDTIRYIVYKNDLISDLLGVDWAMTVEDQFRTVVQEDQPLLRKAFSVALDHGGDDDVVIRVKPSARGAERILRLTTKSLRSTDGEITGAIACLSDVTEATLMGRELERRATFDGLTGCLNRAAILNRLEASLGNGGAGVAALFIDLDGFKAINDRDGHAAGDAVLQRAASVLADCIRPSDVVGRLGGDEFLIVCHDVGTAEAAVQVAERVAASVQRSLEASIGVAWAASGTLDADHLVHRADEAMYASKREAMGRPHLWREDLASAE